MTAQHKISIDLPVPLQQGDQAIVDAIAQIEPGERGDVSGNFIIRRLEVHRSAGKFGELVLGGILGLSGEQEFAFIDVNPVGIMAGIDTREPGGRVLVKCKTALPAKLVPHANSPGNQAIKVEAARRILLANQATS